MQLQHAGKTVRLHDQDDTLRARNGRKVQLACSMEYDWKGKPDLIEKSEKDSCTASLCQYAATVRTVGPSACSVNGTIATRALYVTLPTDLLLLYSQGLLVELKLIRLTRSFDLARICILQILLNDIIPVLPHRPQTRLLHDRLDDGA